MVRSSSWPSARSSDQAATYHALRRYVALTIFRLLSIRSGSGTLFIGLSPLSRLSGGLSRAVKRRLPREPAYHRLRKQPRRREDFRQRGGVGILPVAELLGVDAGGHEQAIDAKGGGTLEVGAHGIADRQQAVMRDRAAARGLRQRERLLVDRPVGLAGIDHLAARGMVEV